MLRRVFTQGYRQTRQLHSTNNLLKVQPLILSDIGEGTRDVEVLSFLVQEGDKVSAWDDIVEVQSDKASVNIQCAADGVVTKVHWEEGDTVKVGEALVDIDYDNDDVPGGSDKPEEVVIEDQNVMATPAVKKLARTLKVDLTKITGTGANGRISKSDVESAASSGSTSSSSSPVAETSGKSDKVLTTPKIRGYAKSKNVDLSEVVGTGQDGRISQADVDAFLATPAPVAAAAPTPAFAPMVSATPAAMALKPVDLSGLSAPVVKKLTPIQKAMVSSMNMANQVPHFGYSEEYNMNALVEVRAALKEQTLKETGVKISYMPFIIKALSLALHEFPMLNASLNKDQNEVTYHPRHNIGFATDTPHGLLVPNIKDCQSRSILEIASELNRLHQVGLQNKLKPDDLTGGTFSLSNIGAIGGTYASPVLLMPQVAIGALGKIQKLPRFDANGNVTAHHIMAISWACDHRIIEGAQCAKFSNKLKFYLENPAAMLLHLK